LVFFWLNWGGFVLKIGGTWSYLGLDPIIKGVLSTLYLYLGNFFLGFLLKLLALKAHETIFISKGRT
jgi:hypothetical protein